MNKMHSRHEDAAEEETYCSTPGDATTLLFAHAGDETMLFFLGRPRDGPGTGVQAAVSDTTNVCTSVEQGVVGEAVGASVGPAM